MLVTKVQMNFKYKHRAHAYVSSPALQIQEMKNQQTEKRKTTRRKRRGWQEPDAHEATLTSGILTR